MKSKRMHNNYKNQLERTNQALKSDNSGKYAKSDMENYLKEM